MTKTDIQEYWQLFDEHILATIENYEQVKKIHDIDYHVKRKECLRIANFIDKVIDGLILLGQIAKAKDYASLGISYIEHASRMVDRQTSIGKIRPDLAKYLYASFHCKFEWLLKAKEDLVLLEESYKTIQSVVNKERMNRSSKNLRSYVLTCVTTGIKFGAFDEAREAIQFLAVKKRAAQELDVVYDEILFLDLITRSLLGNTQNSSLHADVEIAFNKLYDLLTTSIILIQKYGISRLIDISYIYYKYFDKSQSNLDPIRVIRSVRYGKDI